MIPSECGPESNTRNAIWDPSGDAEPVAKRHLSVRCSTAFPVFGSITYVRGLRSCGPWFTSTIRPSDVHDSENGKPGGCGTTASLSRRHVDDDHSRSCELGVGGGIEVGFDIGESFP